MSGKRVLVIDDEKAIQTVIQFGIKLTSGWQVLIASSGAEGIQTAQTEKPDVILLDVRLPDMDGTDIVKALQAHAATKDIPVIFLTAQAQTIEKPQLSDLGVRGMILKPFNSLHLPEQISRILHWSMGGCK